METGGFCKHLTWPITGADSDWSKLKPHSWRHTCLGTQPSLWSEFLKSLNRAVKYSTDHSSHCLVPAQGGFMQKVLASQNVARPTWGLGFQPSNTSTRRQERRTAGRCYVHTHQPPRFTLEGWKQSSYIWDWDCHCRSCSPVRGLHLEEYSYQQGISSRESSKLWGKKWKRAYKCLRYWTKHASGLYSLLLSDAVKLEKLPFHSKTWSLVMYFSKRPSDANLLFFYFSSLNMALNLKKGLIINKFIWTLLCVYIYIHILISSMNMSDYLFTTNQDM